MRKWSYLVGQCIEACEKMLAARARGGGVQLLPRLQAKFIHPHVPKDAIHIHAAIEEKGASVAAVEPDNTVLCSGYGRGRPA